MSKLSLNDMVELGFGDLREVKEFQTEFCLDDRMPNTYTPDQGYVLYSVQEALITHLPQEYWTHGKGSRRISTSIKENKQVLQLDHCGEHMPTEKLRFINETLRLISLGQELTSERFRPSGNNMAARCLAEKNGTMKYENIQDGVYKIRCTVTLPLIQP